MQEVHRLFSREGSTVPNSHKVLVSNSTSQDFKVNLLALNPILTKWRAFDDMEKKVVEKVKKDILEDLEKENKNNETLATMFDKMKEEILEDIEKERKKEEDDLVRCQNEIFVPLTFQNVFLFSGQQE